MRTKSGEKLIVIVQISVTLKARQLSLKLSWVDHVIPLFTTCWDVKLCSTTLLFHIRHLSICSSWKVNNLALLKGPLCLPISPQKSAWLTGLTRYRIVWRGHNNIMGSKTDFRTMMHPWGSTSSFLLLLRSPARAQGITVCKIFISQRSWFLRRPTWPFYLHIGRRIIPCLTGSNEPLTLVLW